MMSTLATFVDMTGRMSHVTLTTPGSMTVSIAYL